LRTVTTENQQELKEWITKELNGQIQDNMWCIGLKINGEIRSVVSYTAFKGKSCNMSIASKGSNWMTKDYLWAMFDYPFNVLKLKVIIGTIWSKNVPSLRLSRKLGFKEIATIADAHENGDLVLMELRQENCKALHINAPLKKVLGV